MTRLLSILLDYCVELMIFDTSDSTTVTFCIIVCFSLQSKVAMLLCFLQVSVKQRLWYVQHLTLFKLLTVCLSVIVFFPPQRFCLNRFCKIVKFCCNCCKIFQYYRKWVKYMTCRTVCNCHRKVTWSFCSWNICRLKPGMRVYRFTKTDLFDSYVERLQYQRAVNDVDILIRCN